MQSGSSQARPPAGDFPPSRNKNSSYFGDSLPVNNQEIKPEISGASGDASSGKPQLTAEQLELRHRALSSSRGGVVSLSQADADSAYVSPEHQQISSTAQAFYGRQREQQQAEGSPVNTLASQATADFIQAQNQWNARKRMDTVQKSSDEEIGDMIRSALQENNIPIHTTSGQNRGGGDGMAALNILAAGESSRESRSNGPGRRDSGAHGPAEIRSPELESPREGQTPGGSAKSRKRPTNEEDGRRLTNDSNPSKRHSPVCIKQEPSQDDPDAGLQNHRTPMALHNTSSSNSNGRKTSNIASGTRGQRDRVNQEPRLRDSEGDMASSRDRGPARDRGGERDYDGQGGESSRSDWHRGRRDQESSARPEPGGYRSRDFRRRDSGDYSRDGQDLITRYSKRQDYQSYRGHQEDRRDPGRTDYGHRGSMSNPHQETHYTAERNNRPTYGSARFRLEDVLDDHPDLQLFLQHHGWFDVEKREKLLAGLRKLAAIDAEAAAMKAERERALAELARVAGAGSFHSSHPPPTTHPSPPTQPAALAAPPTNKRPYDQDSDGRPRHRLEKIARIEDKRDFSRHQRCPSASNRDHDLIRHGERRPASPSRYEHDRQSPGPFPAERRNGRGRFTPPLGPADPRDARSLRTRDNSPDRHYDSSRRPASGGSQPGAPRGSRYLDFGGKGDVRFFLVKSFNQDNVRRSMEDGVWTTQLQNGEVLEKAFTTCKHVILVFSVNKSKGFQGWARMESLPSESIPRPRWMNVIHWETTPPFRVNWYNTTTTEFFRVHHLKNSLRENAPVIVGKDGQEIEEECGRNLIHEMDQIAEIRATASGGSASNGNGGRGHESSSKYHDKQWH